MGKIPKYLILFEEIMKIEETPINLCKFLTHIKLMVDFIGIAVLCPSVTISVVTIFSYNAKAPSHNTSPQMTQPEDKTRI